MHSQTKNRMKFEPYKDVVLTRDVPAERLKRGDIVKLVEHERASSPPRTGTTIREAIS